MVGAGFVLVSMTKEREASSRRPYEYTHEPATIICLAAADVDFCGWCWLLFVDWLGVVCRDQAAWFLYLVATHDGSGAEGGGDGGGGA